MRHFAVIILLLFFSCDEEKRHSGNFSIVDYTYYNGWDKSFSAKIDEKGNVIISKRDLGVKRYFRTEISEQNLRTIDSLLGLSTNNKDTSYIDSGSDKPSFRINITSTSNNYSIYVYGDRYAPKNIIVLRDKLNQLFPGERLLEIDTNVDFKSQDGVYPPQTDTNIKFIPPSN